MSGKRNPATVQWEVWVSRAASDALNVSAQKQGITRGEYIQNAIWRGVATLVAGREKDVLFPQPRHTNARFAHLANPAPGYKGRWSMWVRARCTVHNSVPMLLTRAAEQHGYGSASAYTRQLLAVAIKKDTGKTVPMPPGRTPANLFGGKINEEVR